MITDILQWFRIRPDPNHLAAPAPTETLQFVISRNMSINKDKAEFVPLLFYLFSRINLGHTFNKRFRRFRDRLESGVTKKGGCTEFSSRHSILTVFQFNEGVICRRSLRQLGREHQCGAWIR